MATARVAPGAKGAGRERDWRLAGGLLAGILIVAVAVRFAGIGSRLSVDDAYSWFAASSPNAHVFLRRLADNENSPPLIYLALMVMPGSGPVWLRLPAAIPGVLLSLVVYLGLRSRLGERTSLLAALGVAVSPYLITYSNLARGFMLADLALLIATWCVLSLAEHETTAKWVIFFLAGTVAVYTEYGSVIFLVALVAGSLWIGVPRRRSMAIAGGLVMLSLVAWVPQIIRGQHQVGVTKFDPLSATPSLSAVRDLFDTLALGENGGTGNPAGRWVVFAVILGFCAFGYLVLRRGWESREPRAGHTIVLLACTALLTIVGYALAAVVGVDVFTQRYLTILVPLAAALGAVVVVSLDKRWVLIGAVLALTGLGLGNFAVRLGGQWQPSLSPVRDAATALHPRTVLTDSPLVLYYLPSFRPLFDRPYNLGAGDAQTCGRPCLIIDDLRTTGNGPPRQANGTQTVIGPFRLTDEH